VTISPTGNLYRIAPSCSPWEAYKNTSFEQRFDDPQHRYFVLYACSQRLGCFVECLAYFRVDPDKPGFAELEEKFGDSYPEGTVPAKWCAGRFIQSARVVGQFADVANSGWIAKLRKDIPFELGSTVSYPWIDQSTIYQDKFRTITQWISRTIFSSEANFAGLYYTSKLGSDFSNWAVFEERANFAELGLVQEISEEDVDLLSACRLLSLKPPTGARTTAPVLTLQP
jgi:hypothetical protein